MIYEVLVDTMDLYENNLVLGNTFTKWMVDNKMQFENVTFADASCAKLLFSFKDEKKALLFKLAWA